IAGKSTLPLHLPDGEELVGYINGSIPVMDSSGQTQRILLKVKASHQLPENLIAKVKLIKRSNTNATILPKPAILADETQTKFWVMKMINDSTAIKVDIKKGIEAGDSVEITSPAFTANDRILTSGNFSLSDTAKVKIVAEKPKE
ncbi:MAG TPA: hypothetical protein VKH37_09095, partial [Ferruginibacter sp.]|nr:hypothetical protein [Ferruginibacter sp.]